MLSHVSVLALVGLVTGCGLVLAAMITRQWLYLEEGVRVGLFSSCSLDACTSINFTAETEGRNRHSQFKAIRGLLITGLIVSICGSLMALGFVADALRSKGVRSVALLRSSLVLNSLGGLLTVLASCVFASTVYHDTANSALGFSFCLGMAGGALVVISGALVYVGGPRKVTVFEPSFSPAQTVLGCMQPPPQYTFPSEEFLIAQYKPPPAYEAKTLPPAYEEVLMLPPNYEEV